MNTGGLGLQTKVYRKRIYYFSGRRKFQVKWQWRATKSPSRTKGTVIISWEGDTRETPTESNKHVNSVTWSIDKKTDRFNGQRTFVIGTGEVEFGGRFWSHSLYIRLELFTKTYSFSSYMRERGLIWI